MIDDLVIYSIAEENLPKGNCQYSADSRNACRLDFDAAIEFSIVEHRFFFAEHILKKIRLIALVHNME